jgi:hypothetical protein
MPGLSAQSSELSIRLGQSASVYPRAPSRTQPTKELSEGLDERRVGISFLGGVPASLPCPPPFPLERVALPAFSHAF